MLYIAAAGKNIVSQFEGFDRSIKLYLNICSLLTLLTVDAFYIYCIHQLEVIGRTSYMKNLNLWKLIMDC